MASTAGSSFFNAILDGARLARPALPDWLTILPCYQCKRGVDRMTAARSNLMLGVEVAIECHGATGSALITNEMIEQESRMTLWPFLPAERGPQLFATKKAPVRSTGAGLIGNWIRYTGLVPRGELVYCDADRDARPRLTRPDGTVIALATGWARLDGVVPCEPPVCSLCGAAIVGVDWLYTGGAIVCGGEEAVVRPACEAPPAPVYAPGRRRFGR